MKVKAAKKPAAKKAIKAPKKPVKKAVFIEPPPYSVYQIAEGFDDICNRLAEVTCIMDAIMDDVFDITNKRQSTLLCLMERMTRETLEKTNELTSDLYNYNRKESLK